MTTTTKSAVICDRKPKTERKEPDVNQPSIGNGDKVKTPTPGVVYLIDTKGPYENLERWMYAPWSESDLIPWSDIGGDFHEWMDHYVIIAEWVDVDDDA
jgi:hypothetical protein